MRRPDPLDRDEVLARLRSHMQELRERHVEAVYLFGSVARGESRSDSDVDVLIEVRRPFTYFDLFDVREYLESLLGCSVDVGTVLMLREGLRDQVLREVVRAA